MNTSNNQPLLDRVMYLASLVSDARAVDPIMNGVREVTMNLTPGQPLPRESEQKLLQVQAKLESFLMGNDPARSFTREELEKRVREHFVPTKVSRAPRWKLGATWAGGILAYALMFAVPGAAPPEVRGQVGAFLLLLILSVGASQFFLSALRDFKPDLKPAYWSMCLGALTIGFAQVQLPVVALLDLGQTPFLRYGGFMLPFAVAMGLMYFGLRAYAKAVGVHSRAMSLPLLGAGLVVICAVVMLLPHGHELPPGQEVFFDLSVASLAAQAVIDGFALTVAFQIITATTGIYARALKWLSAMLALSVVGSIEYGITVFVLGELYGIPELIAAIPFIFAAIVMLQAGYNFKKTSRY